MLDQIPIYRYAEFLSGGGLVRAALDECWATALANDIDPKKCSSYRANWGGSVLVEGDVAALDQRLLRQPIDLYWASSPCQDFSLAGKGAGLSGERSGIFNQWMKLVRSAVHDGFGPKIIAFENVTGLLASNAGSDFQAVLASFAGLGYRVGALEIDASLFLPQSRRRLFVIAVRKALYVPPHVTSQGPVPPFHGKRLQTAANMFAKHEGNNWIWWNPANIPANARAELPCLIDNSAANAWLNDAEVSRLLGLMSDVNRMKVQTVSDAGKPLIGTIYKRGRPDKSGVVRQRVEVRFDGTAGCLRTPGGGSSRQTLVFVDGSKIRMRLMSAREAARLMGLSDTYILPTAYNEAYKIAGDGVAVPVVRFLNERLFTPLLQSRTCSLAA